ncbi:hypothetical protein [Cytobacillus massiliigabonensis]|uniref:hypothetical protein n=1 Tax=Cytobacillus massiliigabonensis TaxID=1871011 RepID=UPI000C847F85|nr:hypothetical protein [Cytobacillus massiliigabonensis]
MSIKEVIDQGKEIKLDSLPWSTGYTPLAILLCIILIVSFIGISYSLWKSKVNIMLLSISIILFLTITGMTLKEINEEKKAVFTDQVNEWRSEVAQEYIETLPSSTKELEEVTIKSEMLNKYTRNWWQIKYTDYGNEIINPAEISFDEDNEAVTKEGMFEVVIDLENDEQSYMEYQYLTEDLGHGVNEGYYNIVIHVPEDFTFEEEEE